MATDKTLVMITGANSGIGFEWSSQLMEKGGFHVFVCSRSSIRAKLPSKTFNLVAAAAKHVEATYGRLDVLINNAAIALEEPTRENMTQSFNNNATSVWFLTQALGDLLKKSNTTARVINVSSGMGSVATKLDHTSWVTAIPALPYRASKTALSIITAQLVWEFKDDNVKFFTVCPGFTVSNLGKANTEENGAKPTDVAVKGLMNIVTGERDGEASKFLHSDGLYDW
ncbi:hypothetical protein WHR41_04911 [Cladosporium halotolerans]|uniref:NAD(P)-binding protein n=1 Tax=Cladosporium halotolerans TaxID=1052096 RepID=A0AB34KRG2_9PEZI